MEVLLAMAGAVAHDDIFRHGQRFVLASLQVIELCPGVDVDKVFNAAIDILYRDIFVALGSVRTQLEPEEVAAGGNRDAPQDDIAVMYGFGAAGQAAVAEAIGTVFYEDPFIGSVLRRSVRPGTFPALEHNGVIVYFHVTVFYKEVCAGVNVDGIRAGRLYRGSRGKNLTI